MLTDEGLIMKHKIYNINNKNDLGLSKKIWVQVISSFKIQLLFKIKTVNLKQGTKNEDFFFFLMLVFLMSISVLSFITPETHQ